MKRQVSASDGRGKLNSPDCVFLQTGTLSYAKMTRLISCFQDQLFYQTVVDHVQTMKCPTELTSFREEFKFGVVVDIVDSFSFNRNIPTKKKMQEERELGMKCQYTQENYDRTHQHLVEQEQKDDDYSFVLYQNKKNIRQYKKLQQQRKRLRAYEQTKPPSCTKLQQQQNHNHQQLSKSVTNKLKNLGITCSIQETVY